MEKNVVSATEIEQGIHEKCQQLFLCDVIQFILNNARPPQTPIIEIRAVLVRMTGCRLIEFFCCRLVISHTVKHVRL